MCCGSGLQLGWLCVGAPILLSRCGHYRLSRGRVEDALRAPLRGRAAPGPGPGRSLSQATGDLSKTAQVTDTERLTWPSAAVPVVSAPPGAHCGFRLRTVSA
jgi:hypothetical protein